MIKEINKLQPIDLNCNIFSVYDYDGLSIQELLCEFFTKISECVEYCNSTLDLIDWLVNEGLALEVAKKLNEWLVDGTLKEIINEEIFHDLNDKIDRFNDELRKSLNNIEIDMLQFDDIIGDGVNDDSVGINRIIDEYCGSGATLKFPKGEYLCKSPINLKGIKIKGDFGSPYASVKTKGTLFNFNGGDGFVHNITTGNMFITNHIEGVNITNCDVAIKHTYQVQSTFKNIHITDCNYGVICGDYSVIGALFCLYENIYVRRAKETALVIKGKNHNNSHTFNRCEFFGITGMYVNVEGGYGATNLTFNDCEFGTSANGENELGQPLGRRGVILNNTKMTVFNQCYFENPSSSLVLANNSDASLNHCVYGSHSSNNVDGDESVIVCRNSGNFVEVNGGFVSSDNTKMKYFVQHDNVDKRIFISNPIRMVLPKMEISKNVNWNFKEVSSLDITSKESPTLRIKYNNEDEGYSMRRYTNSLGEQGSVESFNGVNVRRVREHRVDYDRTVQFNNLVVLKNEHGVQYSITVNSNGELKATPLYEG